MEYKTKNRIARIVLGLLVVILVSIVILTKYHEMK